MKKIDKHFKKMYKHLKKIEKYCAKHSLDRCHVMKIYANLHDLSHEIDTYT